MADDLLIANVLLSQFQGEIFWLGRQAIKTECITLKYKIVVTKKQNLQLSGLIAKMRNIIHNNGRYCFSDFTCDIEILASMQEKANHFTQYWGVWESGTKITDYAHKVKDWSLSCKFQGIYKITLENGFYTMESI